MTPETTAYLKPIMEAAALLKLRPYPTTVETVGAVLDRLSRGFPGDVMPPLEALRAITSSSVGTVEELDLLMKVWPDYSGDVRYKLTATTLTRCWSSKHTGRYATITVPFPTILPMTVEVERFYDMDDLENHYDECPVRLEEGDDCYCESAVEQVVTATVNEWTDQVETDLGNWLAFAVDGETQAATFPREAA